MLDSEAQMQADDTLEGGEAPEVVVEDEVVISIEGEEEPVDDEAEIEAELGDKGRNALRAAREAAKAASREARELKAKLAAMEPAKVEPELKRPTMEDCGFNEDSFAEQMAAYVSAKKEADAKRVEDESKAKARETAYQDKLSRYHTERTKVGVDDDAQAVVVGALNMQQQTALMDASGDPAKVVAALSRTPKILAELAGITEIHRFTYRLAQIEGKITMTTKAPPPPETKLRGAVASDAISSVPLDKLRDKAEASGDYTAYLAEKRRRTAAGVKA